MNDDGIGTLPKEIYDEPKKQLAGHPFIDQRVAARLRLFQTMGVEKPKPKLFILPC